MATKNDEITLSELNNTADDLKKTFEDVNKLSKDFASTLTGGLKSAIVEGKNFDTVLQEMMLSFSGKVLTRALMPLEAALADGLSTGIQGLFSKPVGAPLDLTSMLAGGSLTPFARGGVVAAPTFFPIGENGLGVAGEAGSEAIMPLVRGSDGRLGVGASGRTGGVNVTLNVTTPDVDGFRSSQGQLTTMLARAVGRGRRGL